MIGEELAKVERKEKNRKNWQRRERRRNRRGKEKRIGWGRQAGEPIY